MKKMTFAMIVFTSACIYMEASAQTNDSYDSTLAKKLGADEYGMKHYVFVILKTGSANITDKNKLDSIFRGHLANIHRLADRGELALAGPFGNNSNNYRGLYIFNVTDTNEVRKLLQTDPAVHAKLLEPEIYAWYGSAATQQINELHKKVARTSF